MKNVGALILEYRNEGVYGSTGSVFIHERSNAHCVYKGPAAFAFYETLKKFISARHAGSGDWFEENTQHGKQWRERGSTGTHYEKFEESA